MMPSGRLGLLMATTIVVVFTDPFRSRTWVLVLSLTTSDTYCTRLWWLSYFTFVQWFLSSLRLCSVGISMANLRWVK